MSKTNKRHMAKFISLTALMTALTTVCTFLGFNIGTGYINMGDTMIFITASIFGPVAGLIAGGLGSFFADLIVYPTTMVFTLIIKGLEGLCCGLLVKYLLKDKYKKPVRIALNSLFMFISAIIMVLGYFFTQWLMWGTKEAAIAQLPWDTLQATASIIVATLLIYVLKLKELISNSQTRAKLPSNNSLPENEDAVQEENKQ